MVSWRLDVAASPTLPPLAAPTYKGKFDWITAESDKIANLSDSHGRAGEPSHMHTFPTRPHIVAATIYLDSHALSPLAVTPLASSRSNGSM